MTTRYAKSITFAVVLPAAIAAVVVYRPAMNEPPPQAVYPIERTVKYSLTVKNPSNKPVPQAAIWLYAPLSQGVYQRADEIASSHPYRREMDEFGNQRLHFEVENLPPYGRKIYTVTARIKLSRSPNEMPAIDDKAFLGEERLMEISATGIKQLARRLAADSEGETVRNIYRWVTANIAKPGYVERDRGALQTLVTRSGDCTGAMYLFSALSRANGIPTRNMAGFTAKENVVLKPRDYHNWLEVFVDGRWRLVDPDRRIFMDQASDYIAMTLLSDAPTLESQASQRLFGGPENIEITMN
ncbi:MAG: transglutaminase domain-containing protein [Candidatus Thiodiazotropha sp. (ex Epidulcina cf. delphinae)]|nr:transglutaminase domain-containing protein [Candidatus Thiodiazotropha sp. (ex Epidulcina cf. delphinae)]